jgi:alanine racemase
MVNKIEIDLNALAHNVAIIKKHIYPETKIIGVVKANAYGHGLVETARVIWTSGVDILATATLEEAIALRVSRIKAPILVLGYVEPSEFWKAIDFDITLTIFDFESAYKLAREAKKQNRWARIDVAVDTGMNRYGFPTYEVLDIFQKIYKLEHLKIEGIHSHFADPEDKEFSRNQIKQMQNVLFSFQQMKIPIPMVHMAATKAIFLHPEAQFDAVRPGIGLYGYSGIEGNSELKPALELKSQIVALRRVGKDETVGYQRTYVAKGPRKIAVIPLGYADGYPRALSNKASVLVNGTRAKIAGIVSMNAIMVDVTGIKCSLNDEVVLIGSQGNGMVNADELAKLAQSNVCEILSRLPREIPREYHFK